MSHLEPRTPARHARHAIVVGPDRTGRIVVVPGALPAITSERLACPDAVIRPGWVNAHTHLYSGLVPFGVPLPSPWPGDFLSILEALWWPLDRALDADTLRAAARVAIGEALLAGTTTLVDHHESPSIIAGSLDVLAEAALSLGIRAVLAYGASERNGGADEAAAGLAECERFARVVGLRHPTLRAMVGLHAGFTVSDPTIARAVALGRELGVPLHLHVAEDEADVADARRRGYPGALARLVAHGAVGPGAVLAHGIHLGRDEVAWVAGSGAFFAQNPRSNRTNGVGYPSVLAGARVALGTDGYPSRMEDEVRVAQDDGARHGEPMTLADERLRAGWELAAWHFADDPPGSSDVCAMGPDGAVHVVVAGRVVVRDGRLVGADIAELRRDASEAAARLATRMQATRENPSGEPLAPAGERAAPAVAGVLRRPADGIHNPG